MGSRLGGPFQLAPLGPGSSAPGALGVRRWLDRQVRAGALSFEKLQQEMQLNLKGHFRQLRSAALQTPGGCSNLCS